MDESDWYNAEVYVRGTNLLAKFSKQSGNVKTDYQYYTQNAHGDVVNLTDADGAITKSYTYDAFGVEQNIDDADTNAFRYCGEYYDSETGTVYLRARYYNPSIGRFISRDSYAGNNGSPLSLNLYTYCQNNPIAAIDPSGHMSIKEFWQGSKQCWRDGINEMKSMGGGARFFANYSEGIMDTLGGQINTVLHPLKTAKTAASDYVSACKSDIRNIDVMNYARTKMLTSVVDGLSNFGKACYNKNWDSVAHQLGGGTVILGETCAAYLGAEAVASKATFSVSNGSMSGTSHMQLVRTIQKGESVDSLISEVKALTFETGNEHAVVKLANGQRAIVSGGTNGVSFGAGEVTRIYGHSHPYQFGATGPSSQDINALGVLGQKSSYLLEHGTISNFFREWLVIWLFFFQE